MNLPEAFLQNMKSLLPDGEFDDFVRALSDGEQPTSVRINPRKFSVEELREHFGEIEPIGWCDEGFYLKERPQFTLDPLLHAGCYYVQEASSMFVAHILKTLVHEPVCCLDLCAAPGGKSTAALGVLPEGSYLVSNEIDRRRARILAENITKWGYPNVAVTCSTPKDFRKMREAFDVIITDVPCSGEGMFRKDEGAVADWSPSKVAGCAALQHEILDIIWPCLRPGGLLVYSTCTFNTAEDEEMVEYICSTLGGETQEIPIDPSWNIHPQLLSSEISSKNCYRFMPHFTRGEGLFMAAIRKSGEDVGPKKGAKNKVTMEVKLPREVFVLQQGIEPPTQKGKDLIPSHAQALAVDATLPTGKATDYPRCEVPFETALDYLRRLAIILPPDTPRGFVVVTYHGHPLGFVKNLGSRSNNLYPQEWRIRNL